MIHHLAHVVKSPILILYVMESLAESGPTPCWDGDALKSLRYLVDRHRHFEYVNFPSLDYMPLIPYHYPYM